MTAIRESYPFFLWRVRYGGQDGTRTRTGHARTHPRGDEYWTGTLDRHSGCQIWPVQTCACPVVSVQGDYRRNTVGGSVRRMLERGELHHFAAPIRPLRGFSASMEPAAGTRQAADVLPMREQDNLTLVDLTGRLVVRGKRGRINPSLTPILDRLGLSPAQWGAASTGFRQHYRDGNMRLNQTA